MTRLHAIAALSLAALLLGPGCATEDQLGRTELESHSWATYHWARTTSSFDLTVINSTTSDWDGYVAQAVSDWSQSTSLNLIQDLNGDTSSRTRRRCQAPSGGVRICNLEYGQTGWLGIAGINLDPNGHIDSGYTKLNDTYFASSFYNTFDWKQSVTCQELGHDLGLGHQDEDFNNQSLFTCMDYQDPPFPYPNAHDYEQLTDIYAHLDAYDSYAGGDGGGGGGVCNSPPGKGCNKPATSGFGRSIGIHNGRETFVHEYPDGSVTITVVTWVGGHDD